MSVKYRRIAILILIICFCKAGFSQNENPKIDLDVSIVKNVIKNKNLEFKIFIKNIDQKSIIVGKNLIVASNKFSEADIGFEIQKCKGKTVIDWQFNCYDMEIDRVKPPKKDGYDTLLNNSSKIIIANIFRDCKWDRGNYKIRFIFYLNNFLLNNRDYKVHSKWVSFKL